MDSNNRKKAHYIGELFENLLEEKNIDIPCADKDEENERRTDEGNSARIYGMEWANLVDSIESYLNGKEHEEMESHEKEVNFGQYCATCKHKDEPEYNDPCNECLNNPSNTDSHKPVNWEAK